MHAALLIAAKDLRQRLRDRSAIMVAFVVPLGLAFVFNATLGGISTGGTSFRYGVVDEDRSQVSSVFADEVLPAVQEGGAIRVQAVPSEAEGRRMVADGELAAMFVVPAGFGSAVQGSDAARIRVIGDVDEPTGTQIARSIASRFAADLNAVRVAVATVAEPGWTPMGLEALVQRAAATATPVEVVDVGATTRELDTTTYYAAGMAVFFLFFTVQFGVASLLDERKDGTLSRLLAAPIGSAAILGGKLLTSFVIGTLSMATLIVATSLLLGADWGSPMGVALLVVSGVLAAVGIMSIVATLAKTSEQAGNWQSIIAVVLGMLGGVFFPISQAPGILPTLSLLTPQAWFLRGLSDLAGGTGWTVVLPAVLAMLVFAAVTSAIASVRLDRMARL
ncbi:MAG TPA: ABC transporter permease [Actinomycetota bacterium]|nr:ABC transporter permease [Actinomycetota bacterium]